MSWRYLVFGLAALFLYLDGGSPAVAGNSHFFKKLLMPGDVIEGHAEFEHECQRCHGSNEGGGQKSLCLECHEEVASDIAQKEGLHGRLFGSTVSQCQNCHSEHLGREGDIVNLDTDSFDHKTTDFDLVGSHAGLLCASCHPAAKKFREAPIQCYSCHKQDDFHNGSLGKECQDCHAPTRWRESDFDHGDLDFDLLGRHQEVRCNACHADNSYTDTPMACYSCHAISDVHEGSNGEQCDKCHSEKGWDQIGFDHDIDTKFALRGSHGSLPCNACHEQSAFEKKPGSRCIDCHRDDDEHDSQNGAHCETCHSEDRWQDIGFNHRDETQFELFGKHSALACESCHRAGTLAKLGSDCIDCHKVDDVHAGQQGVVCNTCHNESGWFDDVRFDHSLTAFPLVGIHAVTSCEACHSTKEFSNTGHRCIDCHAEDDAHARALGVECGSCHNPNDWQLWLFDHNEQTKFVLDGAHEGLGCNECHLKATKSVVKQSAQCGACHLKDDVHERKFGRMCDRCHTTSSFKTVRMQ